MPSFTDLDGAYSKQYSLTEIRIAKCDGSVDAALFRVGKPLFHQSRSLYWPRHRVNGFADLEFASAWWDMYALHAGSAA